MNRELELKYAELINPNPCAFTAPFQWKFILQSTLPEAVPVDIAFVWVGSARTNEYDIVLDEFELCGITPGTNEVVLEHQAPDISCIPREDLFGMTVMTITLSIAGKPFLRVAYLVSVGAFGEMSDAIASGNSQPPQMQNQQEEKEAILSVLGRNVLADKPRLHVFEIDNWAGWVSNGDGTFRFVGNNNNNEGGNNNNNNNNNNNENDGACVTSASGGGGNFNNNNNNNNQNFQQGGGGGDDYQQQNQNQQYQQQNQQSGGLAED